MAIHPRHPVLVHFPIACCSLAALLDAARPLGLIPHAAVRAVPNLDGAGLSYALLALGVASAVPAMVAGFVDLVALPPALQQSRALTWHVTAMSTAWALFLAALLLRARGGDLDARPAWGAVALEAAGTAVLVAGGHYAAAVVFEHWPGQPYTDRSSEQPPRDSGIS